MWLIGLILGLVLGSALAGFSGAVMGAALGALIGHRVQQPSERRALERLAHVEDEVALLRAELSRLKSSMPAGAVAESPAPQRAGREAAVSVDYGQDQGLAASEAGAPLPAAPSDHGREDDIGAQQDTGRAIEATTPADERAHEQAGERSPVGPSERPAWLNWLLGGNTVVRGGIVVLFFGIAFLLKYAYDHTNVPIELRLIGVALAAVVMLMLGWRLRGQRPGYALTMQGGGIAVLYLTVFAAFRLFHLLPAGAAFALLCAIGALSAVLAILQNAQVLAVIGAGGGFLAPVLVSTGSGSHVMLFGYYALLDAGILAMARFRPWRVLNLTGFAFTFGVGALWGADNYHDALLQSTQAYLALFFLMFVALAVLFARHPALGKARAVDASLVFGVPLVSFGMQLRLMRDIEFGAAFSALALGLFYLVLSRTLWKRLGEGQRMLVESFIALGIGFATLAIPLAFDGRWTAAAWAVEGAALLWIGVRQNRSIAQFAGLVLQLAAGAAFLHEGEGDRTWPVLNSHLLGCVLIAAAGMFSNWWLARHRDATATRLTRFAATPVFLWGLAWWLGGAVTEIDRSVPTHRAFDALLLFLSASAAAFAWLEHRCDWRIARHPALALLPAAALLCIGAGATGWRAHPFAALGWLSLPMVSVVHLRLLRQFGQQAGAWMHALHAATPWFATAIIGWEMHWWAERTLSGAWPSAALILAPLPFLALARLPQTQSRWPISAHPRAYLLTSAAGLAFAAGAFALIATAHSDGDATPLPYVALVNPLDLSQIAAVLLTALWWREVSTRGWLDAMPDERKFVYGAIGGVAFLCANGVLLRALHHYAGIAFTLPTLWHSMLVQAALSLFWSVLALCIMVFATRVRQRALWIVGAALMAAVVAKLFLVDLSNVSGVERIVSFIGVGVLMLVIGYLSPVPPRKQEEAT